METIIINHIQDTNERPKKEFLCTIKLPIDEAIMMRAKGAQLGHIETFRGQQTIDYINNAIADGTIEPITVEYEEFAEGMLTDGRHRLLVYREKGYKEVEIRIHAVPRDKVEILRGKYEKGCVEGTSISEL